MSTHPFNILARRAIISNQYLKQQIHGSPEKPVALALDCDGVPNELRYARRWVLWNYRWEGDRWKKPPMTIAGKMADITDSSNWDCFDSVCMAYEGGDFDGIGFVLGDGLSGVDIDNCRNPETGEIADWARQEVNRISSYTEISPSGTGLKIFVHGKWNGTWHKHRLADGGEIEAYDSGRYFTVTGIALSPAIDVVPSQVALDELASRLEPVHANGEVGPRGWSPVQQRHKSTLPDEVLFRRMLASINGDRIRMLWEGDTGVHKGDDSRADLALCNHLAYWFGEPERVDAMFRRSGLMRLKWNDVHHSDGHTYGQMTINRAFRDRTDFYSDSGRKDTRANNNYNSICCQNLIDESTVSLMSLTTRGGIQ